MTGTSPAENTLNKEQGSSILRESPPKTVLTARYAETNC